jgi:segregation and condensation protein B
MTIHTKITASGPPAATGLPAADATSDGHGAPEAPELRVALLESLLFVSPGLIALERLAQIMGLEVAAVEGTLARLIAAYQAPDRGLRVIYRGNRVQLTSAPEASPFIERLLGLDLNTRLSGAAMEALAVIAYRQPLTRADVEAVRGVNCDGVIRTLLARELIEPVGRLEQAGRPYQYGTTAAFLQYLGIGSLEQLPPLPDAPA